MIADHSIHFYAVQLFKNIRTGAPGNNDARIERRQVLQQARLADEYYEAFDVNSKNCTQSSLGTLACIPEAYLTKLAWVTSTLRPMRRVSSSLAAMM
jgi:hypothetical protein